jgi:GNAT superfamily N-acetyltransferase
MIKIREATEEDNQALIELQANCPQGTNLILKVNSSPDFFARSRPFKDWSVLVAVDDGRIVGSAGYAVNDVLIEKTPVKAAYEYGFMVDPKERRKGIAANLQEHVERRAKKKNVDLLSLSIIEDNLPSMNLFTKLGFKKVKDCATYSLMVYGKMKLAHEANIRRAEESDLADVADLINEMYEGYDFFYPLRTSDLLDFARRTPGFSLDNIFVFEDSEGIKACLGCWDCVKVRKYIVQRFSSGMKAQLLMLKIAGLFANMPRIPGAGEPFLSYNLTTLAFKDSASITDLLKYVNNIAFENKIHLLQVPADVESPAAQVLSKFRHSRVGTQLLIKSLSGKKFPHLGESKLYVDATEI